MSIRKMIRVMLMDDHLFMLQGLELSLKTQADIEIAGSFSSSQALLEALQRQSVELVLLDYSLGPDEIDGLNLVRGLKKRFPGMRLLVLSALHNPATVAMVMRSGADGFIGKEVDPSQLPIAIRRVVSGKTYLAETMSEQFREQEISSGDPSTAATNDDTDSLAILATNAALTGREHEVMRCLLDGMSVTQIANKFSRSIKTISTQKQAAYKKLGLNNDNELKEVRYLLEGQ